MIPDPSIRPDHDAQLDARFDAALRAAAPSIPLPADPSPERASAWSRAALHAPAPRPAAAAAAPRARRRILTGLSAAAATLALAALALLSFPLAAPVKADTILSSLRTASISGVRVSLINLEGNGAALSGELEIHFPHAFPVERLLDDPHADLPDPSAIVFSADLHMHDDGPVPGLRASAAAAIADETSWFFARSTEIAPDALASGKVPPAAALLANFLKSGLLVDFGPGLPARLDPPGDHRAAPFAIDPDAPRASRRDTQLQRYLPQIRALLAGDAGAADLETLRRALQRDAAGATVQPLGDGRFLLSAAGPDTRGHVGLLQIAYTQGAGVEWIEFSKLEGLRGTIRIQPLNSPIDPAKLDKARFLEPGRTISISPEMFRGWIDLAAPR